MLLNGHWAAQGIAATSVGTTFVSQAALDSGLKGKLGSRRRFAAVVGTRDVRRDSLAANTAVAAIGIDPAMGTVQLDGQVLACAPAQSVPMSRRYLLM